MTVYGFNKPKAEILSRHASMLAGKLDGGIDSTGQEVRIVRVPAAQTLNALVETTQANASVLYCEQFFVGSDPADDGLLTQAANNLKVYNATNTTFDAGQYLLVIRNETKWMAVAGGGNSVKTFVSSSSISGRSGNTAGTGTAVSYTYNSVTGDLDTGTESPPYDIVNPYSQPVSNGIVLQAKPAAGGKWELIQAECEDPIE